MNENVRCYFRQLMCILSLLRRPLAAVARSPNLLWSEQKKKQNMYMNESSTDKISCWPAFKQSAVYNWNCYCFIVLLRRFCLFHRIFLSKFLLSVCFVSFLILLPVFVYSKHFLFFFFAKIYTYIYALLWQIYKQIRACHAYKHIAHFNYSKDRTSWMRLISRKEKRILFFFVAIQAFSQKSIAQCTVDRTSILAIDAIIVIIIL